VTLSAPSGSPPAMSIGFQQLPSAGQVVNLSFNLPDGSTETVAMTATDSTTPKPGEFTIGLTAAATAANFRTALNTAVGKLAATSLSAASAMAAAHDFFDIGAGDPPMRVAGPPFNSATALVAGTAANTVTWYTGEMGTDPARGTAGAQVDDALSVAYGVRGNEQGIASTIKNIAVFSVSTFSASNPSDVDRYSAVCDRVSAGLAVTNGRQKIADIQAELSFAQATMKDASQRQQEKQVTLSTMLDGIEQANPDQVASQILALQTQLQASLQTTAMLYKLSIVNYL
jgi:flagellar hook-associated protein 3 FlgL